MNYRIKINEVRNQESSIKAFASVELGGSFTITNIKVIQNREGGLFVAMPNYKTNEVTERNEPIYQDICNPITREFRAELNQAVLRAYELRKELGRNALSIGEPENEGEPGFRVAVTPLENANGSLRGYGKIYFEDSFVVNNVRILEGRNGLFVTMPSLRIEQQVNGKPAYQDICFPVTREFREKLAGSILGAYSQAKEAQAENTASNEQTHTAGRDAEENHEGGLSGGKTELNADKGSIFQQTEQYMEEQMPPAEEGMDLELAE